MRAIGDVTPADMLTALDALGHPTVFYHPSRDHPQRSDIPQLLGAVSAATERLVVTNLAAADADGARLWAAGWLQTAGADRGPCGAAQAFDLITMRMRQTARLLEGYRNAGDMAELVRACLTAAAAFATAGAAAARVADWAGQDPATVSQASQQVAGNLEQGADALDAAHELAGRIVDRAARHLDDGEAGR